MILGWCGLSWWCPYFSISVIYLDLSARMFRPLIFLWGGLGLLSRGAFIIILSTF